ncbi:MAG: gfo/Idh/MocA family oxidoreductase [Naasia sp.]|jgi:predicted dehydrogenase|uniref:Gfo/Idh/MocA family protein n=1 Tax=Naasia sp. TaxID=2546198 RepID=UPI00262B9F40|nr:Gfo/Idh/MocA family oxidoreductase [Naasia sp.]MCU1570892.1 gfo/Idh/MocA family oxidoreductase [Naasia sp.]
MGKTYRVVGVGFDHMHIGDELATAMEHPLTDVVGVLDRSEDRPRAVLADLHLDVPVATELDRLLEAEPDIAFVCSTTAEHEQWVERLAAAGVHIILEKPMADSLEAADRMVAAAERAGVVLAVNWPQAWIASHRTAKRVAAEGTIGRIEQVHYYGGNRGPLYHSHGKIELTPTTADKAESWWYSRAAGGGSLRDYFGYAATLGTWYRDGEMPWGVTAAAWGAEGLEVDEQAVVIGHYDSGLSVSQTRWGTFTDPWTQQPQPSCGFVLNGTEGSISSWDYDTTVTVHTADGIATVPVDQPAPEDRTALANLVAHLRDGRPLDPPLTAGMSRAGHAIVEAAIRSVETHALVRLAGQR